MSADRPVFRNLQLNDMPRFEYARQSNFNRLGARGDDLIHSTSLLAYRQYISSLKLFEASFRRPNPANNRRDDAGHQAGTQSEINAKPFNNNGEKERTAC